MMKPQHELCNNLCDEIYLNLSVYISTDCVLNIPGQAFPTKINPFVWSMPSVPDQGVVQRNVSTTRCVGENTFLEKH